MFTMLLGWITCGGKGPGLYGEPVYLLYSFDMSLLLALVMVVVGHRGVHLLPAYAMHHALPLGPDFCRQRRLGLAPPSGPGPYCRPGLGPTQVSASLAARRRRLPPRAASGTTDQENRKSLRR